MSTLYRSYMEHDETGCQFPEGPILCVNNCGFFGSATTMNMCSKCHKDMIRKQDQAKLAASSIVGIVNCSSSTGDREKEPVIVETSNLLISTGDREKLWFHNWKLVLQVKVGTKNQRRVRADAFLVIRGWGWLVLDASVGNYTVPLIVILRSTIAALITKRMLTMLLQRPIQLLRRKSLTKSDAFLCFGT